ncbi:MAG: nucleotidyltransferase domain-containing protein [Campylobacterota bacterium]|nr:nucleotidyltransferase domain-containing protein [Campylobacterota bacterium]
MTKNEILQKIKVLKETLSKDGFVIDGIFGSYARGDYTEKSDVDILYHLDKTFLDKYSGFIGFKRLDEIKKIISKAINKEIDLAPKNNLSSTAKKYIMKDVLYV